MECSFRWIRSSRAMRNTQYFRTAVRWSLVSSVGFVSVSGAQAWACHAWYEALPDAVGPTRGIATPTNMIHDVVESSRSSTVSDIERRLKAMKNHWSIEKFFDANESTRPRAVDRNRVSGTEKKPQHHPSKATPFRSAVANSHTGAKGKGKETSLNEKETSEVLLKVKKNQPDLLVYVIGDSLVTGVGSSSELYGFGPVLPRRIGERLSDLTGRDVAWVALGKKAADVETIRKEIVGELLNRNISIRPNTPERTPDVVIFLCGVNDFKHAFAGRTPDAFRVELRKAVKDVRDAFSVEDGASAKENEVPSKVKSKQNRKHPLVVLPGMPMQLVTAFPPPLSFVAIAAGDAWDNEKRKVAEEDSLGGVEVLLSESKRNLDEKGEQKENQKTSSPRTVFVPKPSTQQMSIFGSDILLTAKDGIHPNEWGYAAWAHHIAGEVAAVLEKR